MFALPAHLISHSKGMVAWKRVPESVALRIAVVDARVMSRSTTGPPRSARSGETNSPFVRKGRRRRGVSQSEFLRCADLASRQTQTLQSGCVILRYCCSLPSLRCSCRTTVVRTRTGIFAACPQAINTVRVLATDVVQKAMSGHPGAPMGCAPMAHVLFSKVCGVRASACIFVIPLVVGTFILRCIIPGCVNGKSEPLLSVHAAVFCSASGWIFACRRPPCGFSFIFIQMLHDCCRYIPVFPDSFQLHFRVTASHLACMTPPPPPFIFEMLFSYGVLHKTGFARFVDASSTGTKVG